MKTNVAFCPHFHQPHFQLQHTREEVFKNSYLPWIELLEEATEDPDFYINIHLSGPLLLWLAQEKPIYIERLRKLFEKEGVGMIGGLADEAFVQLSARPDDILFQVREYANITARLFGVKAQNWEGIHVVEREAGEWTLYNLAVAARMIGTVPLFYLDAETFYEPHFNYPGGPFDYCRKHFGFDDPHARTTVSHLPPEILFYGLRDEIGGQEFFVLPVHSEFRYRLLKRQSFGGNDHSIIKPSQYIFYLKDAAEKARDFALRLGKELEPVIVIFEDAEKFGQWSKDSNGDTLWLQEFFRLVTEDQELQFCSLQSYLKQQGFLDTYPVASSRSYAEWENWTAKRGIRGVTFGDERLRKVMARQRDLERKLQVVDNCLLQRVENQGVFTGVLRDTVLDSPHRFEFIQEILSTNHSEELSRAYRIIQRVRNLAYQEDPRWASRHPSFGACGYFDLQGMAYLELAERLLDQILSNLKGDEIIFPEVEIRDWDMDGEDEIIIRTLRQTVIIHVRKGQVIFQQVLADRESGFVELLDYLEREMLCPVSYSNVLQDSYSLIFTETDSELREEYYPEGGRVEKCRNSFAVTFESMRDGELLHAQLEPSRYRLIGTETHSGQTIVVLEQSIPIFNGDHELHVKVRKTFTVGESSLHMALEVKIINGDLQSKVYLAPELVTSAVPSDERQLKPSSWLGLQGEVDKVPYKKVGSTFEIDQFSRSQSLAYVYEFINGKGQESVNSLYWEIGSEQDIQKVVIEPAVKSYYRDHVFSAQSELGYDASGLLVRPYVELTNGGATFQVDLTWELGNGPNRSDYRHILQLL